VSVEAFVNTLKEQPDTKIIALSALLTPTMPAMKDTAAALKNSGLKGFKIIVGGTPITEQFAQEVGADGYSADAAGAAALAKSLTA
jgi:methanogenic corrinoid protein MtbC1